MYEEGGAAGQAQGSMRDIPGRVGHSGGNRHFVEIADRNLSRLEGIVPIGAGHVERQYIQRRTMTQFPNYTEVYIRSN